tara:strand:- start:825 stop:1418 length:594 start_codon:yes stop_codon:yes gene_type:complete
MGKLTHISTSNELQIASNLTQARAKIFLETRHYMREALSALFNINPIDIPINAHPGRPPKLPKGMGYISISHCKDAFIIGWYQENIGIDIERSDRDFNYQKLAKKYFRTENMTTSNLNKYSILKEWSAIEAAIKFDRGKLSRDLKEWKYQNNKYILYHKSKKITLNLIQIPFLEWTISLAYKSKNHSNLPKIICNNI